MNEFRAFKDPYTCHSVDMGLSLGGAILWKGMQVAQKTVWPSKAFDFLLLIFVFWSELCSVLCRLVLCGWARCGCVPVSVQVVRPGNLTTGTQNTFRHLHDKHLRKRDYKRIGKQKEVCRALYHCSLCPCTERISCKVSMLNEGVCWGAVLGFDHWCAFIEMEPPMSAIVFQLMKALKCATIPWF